MSLFFFLPHKSLSLTHTRARTHTHTHTHTYTHWQVAGTEQNYKNMRVSCYVATIEDSLDCEVAQQASKVRRCSSWGGFVVL